jgi:tetratricopeptide (TPR) repeat protein
MLKKLFVLILIIFLQFTANSQDNNASRKSVLIRDAVQKNYYTFDIKIWKKIIYDAEALISHKPEDWHIYYNTALAYYQLGKIFYQMDKETAYNYFDKCVSFLGDAKSRTNSIEPTILLSAAYGKKSALSKLSSIYFGIKAKNLIVDANNANPNNPHMLLVAAIHLMHTPETFGGSKSEARNLLNKALKKNTKRIEKDTMIVHWADNAEIYAYLAQIEVLEGNRQKAKYFIDKSLQIVSDYGFIKRDLIPQMDQIK